jgi:serine/threonine-protein kinase
MVAFTGVATSGGTHLFTRKLSQLQAAMVPGADGATMPFFSPDGQWIGFFAGGKLKKVAVAGGAAMTLCDAPLGGGGSWGADDMIVFQPTSTAGTPLQRVSAGGGTPTTLTSMQGGERRQRWPQMLPGARAVLFTSLSDNSGTWDTATIVAQKLPGGPRQVLQRNAYFGRYSRSGHLLYMQHNTLFAAPFDVNRLEVTGSAVAVTDAPLTYNGSSQFAISDTGMAAYVQSDNNSAAAPISWLDSAGKLSPLRSIAADWSSPSFSPDGTRLAMDISDGTQTDIWIYDWARDTMSRLTFDPADDVRPSWSPDGRRVVFASKREKGAQNLYWQRADGVGEPQKLTYGPNLKYGGSLHPSGKFLAYTEMRPQTAGDIMILPLDGDETVGWKPGTPTVFLSTRFNEGSPMFSPDGRWIAYLSNESGRNEVYVRPFPGPGGQWQIWNGLADDPTWSRTKPELLFVSAVDLRIMSAPYVVQGDSFRAEKPQFWSQGLFAPRTRVLSRDVDLHPDGLRFAIAPGSTATSAKLDKIVLTFNFFDELNRLTAKN